MMIRNDSANALRRRRHSRSPQRLSLIVIFAVAIFFVLLLWRSSLASFLWKAGAPFEMIRTTLTGRVNSLFGGFISKTQLQATNVELSGQVSDLRIELADRDALYEENLYLKEELGRPDARTHASTTLLAAVLASPPVVPYDTLVIDVGAVNGIKPGMIVSAGGGVLIGTVKEVYDTASRVVLFSSPGEVHQGLLRGTIPVTVEGEGSGALSAQIPASTPVQVGDPVIFLGIEGGISESVAAIDDVSNDSFKIIHLHLPQSIFGLQFVIIRL